MASSLLRRKVSTLGVSRLVHGITQPFPLLLESKNEALVSVSNAIRQFSASSRYTNLDFTSSSGSSKFDCLDLTRPHTWYPNARRKKRKIFLHMGPTNSGKTHHALKRLESSASGVYCAPLRLLAWEVAKRLNKAKVPCDLITGQEREEIEGAKHKAVTVEMADVTSNYDCAVIDEIQMLSCRTRGCSFTRALLGISADEIHICGDAAAVPLIQDILSVTGDHLEVQYYDRLSPLVPLEVPLGSYKNIQTGDCIVSFSRKKIYELKKQIEKGRKHLCSVVYGSLPPETRTRQASRFNDESSEFDVLVASDAVGMGLNLNISRIIFSTMKKFDGIEERELTVPEIKQIAGRAGRYGSKFPIGEVTCMDAHYLPLLHSSLKAPSPTLERAGLFPTFDLMNMYSRLHPRSGFYEILEHFVENAKLSASYFIADSEEMMKVAAVIDQLPLSLEDKYLFCNSPVDMDDDISAQGLTQFAENYAKKGIVRLREIFRPGMLEVPKSQNELKELESIHKVLDLYVWLSFRLESSFPDHEVASAQKSICSSLIEEFLERFGLEKPKFNIQKLQSLSERVDVISSDESSPSDSEIEVCGSHPGNQLSTNNVVDQPLQDMTSEGALIKRAELYQEYMKQIPIPTHRGSLIPFTSWMGLGKSIKQMYGQPLHYLTNVQLKQWDQLRIGSEDEDRPLDTIVHPSKAEATIWLLEEVHRRTASNYHIAKLWLSDPMHHAFVDSIFPQL